MTTLGADALATLPTLSLRAFADFLDQHPALARNMSFFYSDCGQPQASLRVTEGSMTSEAESVALLTGPRCSHIHDATSPILRAWYGHIGDVAVALYVYKDES